MRRWWWGLAALVLFLVALVAFLPAAVAVRQIEARVPGLALDRVGGTVWNGRAGRVSFGGREQGEVAWSAHPLSLLRGGIELDLDWQGPQRRATAVVRQTPTTTQLRNVDAVLPATLLDPVLDTPALTPQGELRIAIAAAELAGATVLALRGSAVWANAAVTGATAANFGDIHAQFVRQDDGRIVGMIEDAGGPLRVEGEFESTLVGYRAELILSARDPSVIEALQWLGQPLGEGQRLLRLEGGFVGVR